MPAHMTAAITKSKTAFLGWKHIFENILVKNPINVDFVRKHLPIRQIALYALEATMIDLNFHVRFVLLYL